jgi:hypothetical protein
MAWDDLSETYANLGYPGEGGGQEIADIAVIARHPTPESQNRAFRGPRVIADIGKGRALPRINTDDTDQKPLAGMPLGCIHISTLES